MMIQSYAVSAVEVGWLVASFYFSLRVRAKILIARAPSFYSMKINFIFKLKNFQESVLDISPHAVHPAPDGLQLVKGYVEIGSGVGIINEILQGLLNGVGWRLLVASGHGWH